MLNWGVGARRGKSVRRGGGVVAWLERGRLVGVPSAVVVLIVGKGEVKAVVKERLMGVVSGVGGRWAGGM